MMGTQSSASETSEQKTMSIKEAWDLANEYEALSRRLPPEEVLKEKYQELYGEIKAVRKWQVIGGIILTGFLTVASVEIMPGLVGFCLSAWVAVSLYIYYQRDAMFRVGISMAIESNQLATKTAHDKIKEELEELKILITDSQKT